MTPSLDIIIVSYNTADELDACLAALHASPPAALRHVTVVDNASTDDSVNRVATRWPLVEILRLDRNVGFGAANNIALRREGAPLVLLLNSDTVAPPGAIDTLVDRLVATGAAAAGPRLIDPDGRPEISFGPMLSPAAEFLQQCRGRLARSGARWARRYVARLTSAERDVDWVSGACLLLRRDAARQAGLFDERYFMYEEDVDLCAALRQRGGRILFTPRAGIVHRRGASVTRSGRPVSALYDRSHLAFYEKHRPGWAPLLRLWLAVRGRRIR
jgi:GT2 family glycosyltransferase